MTKTNKSRRKTKKRQDRMAKGFFDTFGGKPKKVGHKRAKSRGTAGYGHPSGYWGKGNPGELLVVRKNGKRVRSNATVSMPLKSLRRLISSARTGKRTSTKVRVRP